MIPSKILLTNNIKSAIADFFSEKSFSKIGIIVDENTKELCLPKIITAINQKKYCIIETKSGEENKNIDSCILAWKKLTDCKFDRNSLVINLGGGIICDMGGFIASTFKRGIEFINIPTTLLSQVDASIGGKIGIDFMQYKNQLGLFKEASKTIISTEFLKTLNKREIKSGFSEIFKHSLIKDSKYFDEIIKNNWNYQNWDHHIKKSIEIKSKIVTKDPEELGLRKILNFGHTIGHGVESTFLNTKNKLLHGEAISVGIICESFISKNRSGLKEIELNKINKYILDNYSFEKIHHHNINKIINNIVQDKKNIDEIIRMTLLKKIGSSTYDISVTKKEIEESVLYFNNLLNK